MSQEDSHTNRNEELIDLLLEEGLLRTPAFIKAMKLIPRGYFFPENESHGAYEDRPSRLSSLGFNISAPHMYAICLENLDIQNGMSFLDIGSGCGHMTAIGSYLVGKRGKSIGIDLRKEIIQFSQLNLQKINKVANLGLECEFEQINCLFLDPSETQFDRIHSGVSCPPNHLQHLLNLLKPNGILVTPTQSMLCKFQKDQNGKVTVINLTNVNYGELIVPVDAEFKEFKFKQFQKKLIDIKIQGKSLDEDCKIISKDPEKLKAMACERDFREKMDDDISFISNEKQKLYANKFLISQRMKYFDGLFSSGMNDSKQEEFLVNANVEVFNEVLKFCYTDNCELKKENAKEVANVASFYRFERLLSFCEKYLQETTDEENVCENLEFADEHTFEQLKNFCCIFILNNYEKVSSTDAYSQLPFHLLDFVIKTSSSLISFRTK